MKTLFALVAVSLFAQPALAVKTKLCPQTLDLVIDSFKANPADEVEEAFFEYIGRKPDQAPIYHELETIAPFEGEFELISKANAQCEYKLAGRPYGASVVIKGTHADPVLQVYYGAETASGFRTRYILYTNLSSYSPEGIQSQNRFTSVYGIMRTCYHGCMDDYVRLGKAEFSKP